MPCKAKELIDKLKVKEQSAGSNRSVYTAAINQLTAMVKDNQAKQNGATEEKAENTVTVPDVDIDIDKLMEELAQPFSGNSESLYKTIPVNTEVLEKFAGILNALPTDSLRQASTLIAFTLGAPKEGIDEIRRILTQGYKQVLGKEYVTRAVNSALNIIYSAQMTKDDSALKDILEYKDAADKGSYNSKYILQRLKKAFSESSAVEDDDNYVAEGPIQFSIAQKAPGQGVNKEETINSLQKLPAAKKLLDAGRLIVLNNINQLEDNTGRYKLSLAGEYSRSADRRKLIEAKKLADKGIDPKAIYDKTGWVKLSDGKWRYNFAKGKDIKTTFPAEGWVSKPLSEVLEFPGLYESYPYLLNVEVEFRDTLNAVGSYDHTNNRINIVYGNEKDMRRTLAHELQHAIQHIEGFSRGASPQEFEDFMASSAYNRYVEIVGLVDKKMIEDKAIAELDYRLQSGESLTENELKAIDTAWTKSEAEVINSLGALDLNIYRKGKALKANPKTSAYLSYKNTLGEFEARVAEQLWEGYDLFNTLMTEEFDESYYSALESTSYNGSNGKIKSYRYNAQGLYDPETKVSYLFSDSLTKDNIESVFYHEVGVHAYLDAVSDQTLVNKAAKLYEQGIKSHNTEILEFFSRVQKRLLDAAEASNKEEILAYIVEEAINKGIKENVTKIDSWLLMLKSISPALYNLVKSVYDRIVSSVDKDIVKDLNDLVTIVKSNVDYVAENTNNRAVNAEIESITEMLATFGALSKGDNTVATVYNNLTKNCG